MVGWQDPKLGKIQTDSPTLGKDTKHMILSLCAANCWKLWGADIKTAFLSGDPSSRDIFFKPPKEIKEWMDLSEDDLFRLEKAAYGLAEAPRLVPAAAPRVESSRPHYVPVKHVSTVGEKVPIGTNLWGTSTCC